MPVSCRSFSRSISLVRQDRGLDDRTSGLRCNPGSANFVTSRMRAVACKVAVVPLQSCCRGARQRGKEASKERLSTRPNVHDVCAMLCVDANFIQYSASKVLRFTRPHVTCCLRATTPSVKCTVHRELLYISRPRELIFIQVISHQFVARPLLCGAPELKSKRIVLWQARWTFQSNYIRSE